MLLKGSDYQYPNGCCPLMVGPDGKSLFVTVIEAIISCYINKQ
jgi:hypothetical protein